MWPKDWKFWMIEPWTTKLSRVSMHIYVKKCPPKCQNIGRPQIRQCSLELWQVEHIRVLLEHIHHGCSHRIVLLDPVRMKTIFCNWGSSMTTWTKWGTLNSLISMQQILFFFLEKYPTYTIIRTWVKFPTTRSFWAVFSSYFVVLRTLK